MYMVQMFQKLGVTLIAEGIKTASEPFPYKMAELLSARARIRCSITSAYT